MSNKTIVIVLNYGPEKQSKYPWVHTQMNEWMNSAKEKDFSYKRVPFNESRTNKGSKKNSPLEHHCNNY